MPLVNRGYAIKAGEAVFKRRARVAEEQSAAWVEYHARSAVVERNTARLKELRLDKARIDQAAAALITPAPRKTRSPNATG